MIYSLPEPYREALLLTEFDGLTQQQLAERVGISLSGAKYMKTPELENDTVKQTVRERYGRIAEKGGSCGCSPTCCSPENGAQENDPEAVSQALGYSAAICSPSSTISKRVDDATNRVWAQFGTKPSGAERGATPTAHGIRIGLAALVE